MPLYRDTWDKISFDNAELQFIPLSGVKFFRISENNINQKDKQVKFKVTVVTNGIITYF